MAWSAVRPERRALTCLVREVTKPRGELDDLFATGHKPYDARPRPARRRLGLYGGPMASVKQIQVTFDCAEPERVARFWCEVLGYVVLPPPEGFATWDDFDRSLPPERQGSAFACIDPSGVGPRLFFQRVPERKVVKNRLHLDVRAYA